MISLDIKSETTTSSSPLSLSSKEETPTLSFSKLLKGVSLKHNDKVVQNGALVLSLGKEIVPKEITALSENPKNKLQTSKNDILLGLLKGDIQEPTLKKTSKDKIPLGLNPQLTKELSVVELKTLVKDAKHYLKDKILASNDFKKYEIKELPKTLKGLAQMAKKFGLDVSKITIEEVKAHAKPQVIKPIVHKLAIAKEETEKTPEVKEVKIAKAPKADAKEVDANLPDIKVSKNNVKAKVADTQEVKATRTNSKEKVADTSTIKTISTTHQEKVANTSEIKMPQTTHKEKPAVQLEAHKKDTPRVNQEVKFEDKKAAVVTKIKSTPLFKAQIPVEHTTEQVLQTKQFKVEHKTAKEKADDTLQSLIRGERVIKSDVRLTPDFTLSSAKVIVPTTSRETAHGLEKLLKGDKSDVKESPKNDGVAVVSKADSFEVKLNEAKQMIKYLSQDVKTAIEDYKSPFTRLKVQLNPQRLGEVDLTIVQRGKNLHINLSSNNTAINTLSMNANDLKVQLNNNGINNASLNFNNNPQGDNSQSQQQQQQQRQNEQKASEEYGYFEHQGANEEILNSLEIVVPHYA